MNREPSLDRLALQIAHTTISLNYPGEEFETLDREVLVVSADVPPQDGETDEQHVEHENANADRTTRRQNKATTTLGCKHLQLQQTISNISNMNLVETACVPETS
jgi:hypothetical protein